MIEVTEEMLAAFLAAWDHENRVINDSAGEYVEAGARDRAGLAAVLAIVERDRSDANGLTRGAAAARRIADRYDEKGKDRSRADWRMWTAMSSGARAVAVRLTELADAEEAP